MRRRPATQRALLETDNRLTAGNDYILDFCGFADNTIFMKGIQQKIADENQT